jgi:17beta-estradiol 17-dehydrogenase / very-long-chain 3-oxoacyl-CoA reductase
MYGSNSWALVTGANEGAGREFCFQLAKKGFNIILLGRNAQRLEIVSQELITVYQNIKTQLLICDLSKSAEVNYFENLFKEIEGLEISILVNNAGYFAPGDYANQSMSDIRNMVLVNSLAPSIILRLVLPKMVSRNKSAVITVNSFAAMFVRPYESIYAASKVFNDYISRACSYEYPNVDFLSIKPGLISTRMIGNRPLDYQTISPEEFVSSTLRRLGRENHSSGHYKHRFVAWYYSVLPEYFRMRSLAERAKCLIVVK